MSNRAKISVWASPSLSESKKGGLSPVVLWAIVFSLAPSFWDAAGTFPASYLAAQASFGSLTAPSDQSPSPEQPKKKHRTKKNANVSSETTGGTFSGDAQGGEAGKPNSPNKGPVLGIPQKVRYRYGMEFEARPGGECSNLFGSAPIPMEWPEQKVTLVEEVFPREARVGYRELKEGGVRQLLFKMRTLQEGQKTEASVVIEVTRYTQAPPSDTQGLVVPKKLGRTMRHYLDDSPFIEVGDQRVRKIARTIKEQTKEESPWNQVSAVFNYVRDHVRYNESLKETTIRGAAAAIETEEGDCEDMSALFIAITRNLGIPARTVRVPDHCWAEFYLEDPEGNGYWFPAQVAGNEALGVSSDTRPILQKGDSFRIPESPREETRYVKELFTGDVRQNGPDPRVQFIREEVSR